MFSQLGETPVDTVTVPSISRLVTGSNTATRIVVPGCVFAGTVNVQVSGFVWHWGAGDEQLDTLSQASTVGSSWTIPDDAS
ncbi:MAG TPA: hypothetical protein VM753_09955 [Anaeromyxobacter sp.]|jgi:hypothetical protein|nr:hypothetical protein [Anaeromyxobacter sp.]